MVYYFVIIMLSLLLSIALMFVTGGYISVGGIEGLHLSILANSILYFLLSLYILKRFNRKCNVPAIVVSIFLGGSLLELPIYIIRWGEAYVTFPDMLLRWIAISVAYLCYRFCTDFKKKIVLLSFYTLFCLWCFFHGIHVWNGYVL